MSKAWPAPAKLNLFLHVLGRRSDGYHELQTVFQFIDVTDELDFTVRDDGTINRRSGAAGVAAENDLIVKAARALQGHSGTRFGVDIALRKNIPIGGGLGGGSSDAATTLVALNWLWSLRLSQEQLAEIGLILGADVPIFVHGHSAFAEGVGEKFSAVTPPAPWYLVIKPDCEVATAAVFGAAELTRNTPPITIADFLSGAGRGERFGNDCEPVVRARYPQVAEAMDWLSQRASPAQLTGTGSCVFASFATREEAASRLAELPARWQAFVTRGMNRSPLMERLAVAVSADDEVQASG
jgi:4-diphosphocytidyl-2-C-methyl-D-erythritol kinase